MATFFNIEVPYMREGLSPRGWAEKYWDTYGFDWDNDMLGYNTVCAWPLDSDTEEDAVQILKENLDEDGIEYSTFEVEDTDAFFGLK